VQDAVLVRGGLPGIDAPEAVELCGTALEPIPELPVLGKPSPCGKKTVLYGVMVSPDFGQTWTMMADPKELANPVGGSALLGSFALGGSGPGIQSWYNEWIRPDPTRAVGGVPTRLLFGLEEVWENENTQVPQTGHSSFHVIGRYFSGTTCLGLGQVSLPAVGSALPYLCPTNRLDAATPTTTTHPDQHDAILIPTGDGGVRLVVGNDGGVYTQAAASGEEFGNSRWGRGANRGFNTLLPYDAVRAKDGTVWMGLQDNGTAKVADIKNKSGKVIERGRIIEAYGGDGFFVAVNPDKSNIAYEEYVEGAMSVTSDGGHSWNAMSPPITHAQFSNPFVMDPLDPDHLMIAGNEVVETGSGPGTSADEWATDYHLGTAQHPGSASAIESPTDAPNQMTALDLVGSSAYVGFCGTCDILTDTRPFKNGLATNVGGSKPGARYVSSGWHIAKAAGLPNRYITSIAIDRSDPRTVYVALGGYARPWTPPGSIDQKRNTRIGEGHVFVSTDAGNHFRDISGNLPNLGVNWVTLRGNQVIAATDVGVFVSDSAADCSVASRCNYQVLGRGLPTAPVYSVHMTPGDSNELIAAVYGRGAWTYRFGPKAAGATSAEKTLPTPKFLGRLVGSFDFETDVQGWTTKTSTEAEEWRRQPPGGSSSFSFQVVPYTNEASARLYSPKLTLPARSKVKVSWAERVNTEPGYDFMTLYWSSDRYVWHSFAIDDVKIER
ncbi:MAG: hypothetical protein LC750_15230, partial [Actinobacteria bacterium]|nr:hypothetical protein [Actinomycetota bacterium]